MGLKIVLRSERGFAAPWQYLQFFILQDIDGQAFLLLDLATLQEHLELKLGPAVKLCHQIERLKVAFFEQYA